MAQRKVVMYKRVKGVPIEQLIAVHEKVQNRLDAESFKGYVRAKSALSVVKARSEEAAAQYGLAAVQGRSEILPVVRGAIDRYLVLSDERGQAAALAIEYGRRAYKPTSEFQQQFVDPATGEIPEAEGSYVLHKAFSLGKGALKGTGGRDEVKANGATFRTDILS